MLTAIAALTTPSETHITRMLELVIFERNFLNLMSELSYDWQHKLPLSHAFLLKESKRHVSQTETAIPLTEEQSSAIEQQFIEQLNMQIMTGIDGMSEKADKYFGKGGQIFSIAWSLTHLMDPHLAHFYASGLLRAFRPNGYIENLDMELL